jgi:CubicO group peptidase (beta-lactamase class C family)
MFKKIAKSIAAIAIVGIGLVFYKFYPQLEVLNGYAARTACSCTFIQHRSLSGIIDEDLAMSPINLASVSIDTIEKSASASVYGLSKRKAVYRNGLGCILLDGKDDYKANYDIEKDTAPDTYAFHKALTSTLSRKEVAAIDALAFDPNKEVSQKQTRALLVLYKDTLVIESYAKGINENTELLGWSMTKSVVNAMMGILSKQNKISITDKALFPAWTDERKDISINDLLHMSSGLHWVEDYATVSEATTMLFVSGDMPAFASAQKMEKKKWYYSSGTTNLLSSIIRTKFPSIHDYHAFPHKYLFNSIGMRHSLIETDEAGNYIGSSYMYATARDWLRFGRLYLKDGVWQGTRILPEGWVKYTTEAAVGSNGKYGAHFWLNKNCVAFPDCPHDIFYADGYQGQYTIIIPSLEMVIVRLGLEDIDMNQLIKTIIDAVKK